MKTTSQGKHIGVSVCISIVVLYAMAGQACNAQSASLISSLVDDVSAANIEAHIDALSNGIGPRNTSETQAEAAEYIANQLAGFGYTVRRTPVSSSYNVSATLPVATNPEKTFVIGAHFDTVADTPGADDNASGVAGMLEIARVLSATRPDFSIEFVGFALEEVAHNGSRAYAEAAAAQGSDLIGMVSLEMIGYFSTQENSQFPFENIPECATFSEEGRTAGDFIVPVGNHTSATLLGMFQQASTQYVPELFVVTAQVAGNGECFPDSRLSDHQPFWDEGFQALMVTDTSFFRNPNYHKPTDTLDTLDLEFARNVTQATLATALVSVTVPEPPSRVMIFAALVLLSGRRRLGPKTRRNRGPDS